MAWTDLLPQPQAPTPNIGANPNALLQFQLNQLRLNEARQEIAGQNALRQMFANPQNIGPTGQFQPTGNALSQLGQVDPNKALEVQNAVAGAQTQQNRNALVAMQVQEAERDKVLEASLPARAKYEEVVRASGDKERAQREATEVLKEQLSPVLPTLSQPMRTMLGESPAFNYDQNTRNLLSSTRFRQALAEERKEKFEGYTKTEEMGPGGPRTIYTAPGKPSLDMAGNPVTPTGQPPFKASEQPPLYNVTTSDGKETKTVIGRRAPGGGFVNDDTGEKISNVVGATQLARGGQSASPEAARATAEAIYEYRQPPLSSYAMRSGTGPEIMRQLDEIGKERGRLYDAKKYGTAKVLMEGYSRTTPNSPGGQMLSINTATQHLEQMQKLAAALKNRDLPAINYVINYARTQLGHPEVTNFDTAAQIVADEVLKSVIGSGAVFDREKLLGQLTNTRSPDQIEGGISTIKGLMGGRVNSLRKQWDSVGLPEDDFTAKLTDQSKDALSPYLPGREKQSGAASGVVMLGNDATENQRKMATAPGGTTFQFPDGSTLRKPQR